MASSEDTKGGLDLLSLLTEELSAGEPLSMLVIRRNYATLCIFENQQTVKTNNRSQ